MNSPKSPRFKLLVVCTANECRSVIGHEAFERSHIGDLISVSSAGSSAHEGTARCKETLSDAIHVNHLSTHIDSVNLAHFDAIFTMEKMHSSSVASRNPASRNITFTLPQAATLVQLLAESLTGKRQDFVPEIPSSWDALNAVGRLQWLISEMNEARSYATFLTEEIPDAHGRNAATHKFALDSVEESVNTVTSIAAEILALNFGTTTGS